MDKSDQARLLRNWDYGGQRAALISSLLENDLKNDKDKLVVVTTGEFDRRDPDDPFSQNNAWVEVVFGTEWKRPAKEAAK